MCWDLDKITPIHHGFIPPCGRFVHLKLSLFTPRDRATWETISGGVFHHHTVSRMDLACYLSTHWQGFPVVVKSSALNEPRMMMASVDQPTWVWLPDGNRLASLGLSQRCHRMIQCSQAFPTTVIQGQGDGFPVSSMVGKAWLFICILGWFYMSWLKHILDSPTMDEIVAQNIYY